MTEAPTEVDLFVNGPRRWQAKPTADGGLSLRRLSDLDGEDMRAVDLPPEAVEALRRFLA